MRDPANQFHDVGGRIRQGLAILRAPFIDPLRLPEMAP